MPHRESVLRQGEQRLKEFDIAPDAGVDALRSVVGRDASADLAIAARLGALPEQASVDMLQALESATSDKLVRKEVRRSLYRLSQRGLAVPASKPATAALPRIGPALEGYLSAADGGGDQLVWLLKALPGGGVAHLFAVVNDPQGLKEVSLAETTRKSLRSARQALWEKHELRMVEADWRYCDFVIDRAFQWAVSRAQPVTGDWRGMRAQLAKEPVTELPPLIYGLLDVEAVRADVQLVAESHLLLDEKELRTWFFAPADVQTYLDEMVQIRDSPLVLNQPQQQERFRALVERAIEELFGGERQASWVRRLQEMAYFFQVTARPDQAKRALAAALALEASTHGGREIGFSEQLARSSLVAYWQMETQREAEQAKGSLIVTPQQAAHDIERRR